MFPIYVLGQSLQYTKWDVQTSQSNNLNVFFKNDTMRWKMAGIINFVPVATYQDSSNFFSIVDLPGPNSCSNIGLYNYQILNDTLIFSVINDTCGGTGLDSRISYFVNSTWTSLNTGLEEINIPITLKAFPNPSQDYVTISVNNFNGNIQTEVFDLIGNRLKVTKETTISLRDYSKGIYILKVSYGDRIEEVKVIKE